MYDFMDKVLSNPYVCFSLSVVFHNFFFRRSPSPRGFFIWPGKGEAALSA